MIQEHYAMTHAAISPFRAARSRARTLACMSARRFHLRQARGRAAVRRSRSRQQSRFEKANAMLGGAIAADAARRRARRRFRGEAQDTRRRFSDMLVIHLTCYVSSDLLARAVVAISFFGRRAYADSRWLTPLRRFIRRVGQGGRYAAVITR